MEWTGLIAIALGSGLLHALDADHLIAVSGMSGMRKTGMHHGLSFSLRWALGHGLSIMLIGSLVLLLGMTVPTRLSHWAEMLVGVMLIGIGLMLLLDLIRNRNSLYMHRHDCLPAHVHLENNQPVNPLHRHRHGTVMVGILHGVAGSAPLLALLPVSRLHAPDQGMWFLLIFSVGVCTSMIIFGGLLGNLFRFLQARRLPLLQYLRGVLGLLAILAGILIIMQAGAI